MAHPYTRRSAPARTASFGLAGVAELVDALVLGTSIVRCGGSSPFARTNSPERGWKRRTTQRNC